MLHLFTSRHFRETDVSAIRSLIDIHGLAALVSFGDDGLRATHLPMLFDPLAPKGDRLIGHMARANAHWRRVPEGAQVLAIFQGANAYVTPSIYVVEEDVPTWNYCAVHVRGIYRHVHDSVETRRILEATVAHFEQHIGSGWDISAIDQELVESYARGTAAFSLEITSIEAATKMSQDKCAADAKAVGQHFDERGSAFEEVAECIWRSIKGQD